MVFDLKVNFHKSYIGTIGVCGEDLSISSKCLNCKHIGIPFKYKDANRREP